MKDTAAAAANTQCVWKHFTIDTLGGQEAFVCHIHPYFIGRYRAFEALLMSTDDVHDAHPLLLTASAGTCFLIVDEGHLLACWPVTLLVAAVI